MNTPGCAAIPLASPLTRRFELAETQYPRPLSTRNPMPKDGPRSCPCQAYTLDSRSFLEPSVMRYESDPSFTRRSNPFHSLWPPLPLQTILSSSGLYPRPYPAQDPVKVARRVNLEPSLRVSADRVTPPSSRLAELPQWLLGRGTDLASTIDILILREVIRSKRVVRLPTLPPIHRHVPQWISVVMQ
jgi:hypothetical protein